jgi:hypothetical protein
MRSQDRARRDTELSRRPMTGQPTLHNRPPNARAKIHRIRLPHPDRPPAPVAMLNQNKPDSGIARRFRLMSSSAAALDASAAQTAIKTFESSRAGSERNLA